MRKKQNLKGRQCSPTTVIPSRSSAALEKQVRENPVVQEVMRLFDARIIAVERVGSSEADRLPIVEQPALGFSS